MQRTIFKNLGLASLAILLLIGLSTIGQAQQDKEKGKIEIDEKLWGEFANVDNEAAAPANTVHDEGRSIRARTSTEQIQRNVLIGKVVTISKRAYPYLTGRLTLEKIVVPGRELSAYKIGQEIELTMFVENQPDKNRDLFDAIAPGREIKGVLHAKEKNKERQLGLLVLATLDHSGLAQPLGQPGENAPREFRDKLLKQALPPVEGKPGLQLLQNLQEEQQNLKKKIEELEKEQKALKARLEMLEKGSSNR